MLVALAFPFVSPLLWKREILGVVGRIINQPIWSTKETQQVSEILFLLDEFSCDQMIFALLRLLGILNFSMD